MTRGELITINGNAGLVASRVMVKNIQNKETFARKGVFKNTHATQTLSVSTDGTNFHDIAAGASLEWEGTFNSYVVKGSGAATTYAASLTVA